MKVAFAPWRMEFILGKREKGCVFCTRAKRKKDKQDYILHRGRYNFVILNKYPYNSGHLMVIPYEHTSDLESLNEETGAEMFQLISRATRVIKKALQAQGFNVGFNVGKAAGAGIEDHVHAHVIPRWFADTNFWPVIGEVKSMPEHLSQTYERLKKYW